MLVNKSNTMFCKVSIMYYKMYTKSKFCNALCCSRSLQVLIFGRCNSHALHPCLQFRVDYIEINMKFLRISYSNCHKILKYAKILLCNEKKKKEFSSNPINFLINLKSLYIKIRTYVLVNILNYNISCHFV